MTVEELNEAYCKFCNQSENCDECKFDREECCQILFGYYKGRADAIEKIALKMQMIKDKHNENPRLYPINYGTICGICTDLWKQLKEQKNGNGLENQNRSSTL